MVNGPITASAERGYGAARRALSVKAVTLDPAACVGVAVVEIRRPSGTMAGVEAAGHERRTGHALDAVLFRTLEPGSDRMPLSLQRRACCGDAVGVALLAILDTVPRETGVSRGPHSAYIAPGTLRAIQAAAHAPTVWPALPAVAGVETAGVSA